MMMKKMYHCENCLNFFLKETLMSRAMLSQHARKISKTIRFVRGNITGIEVNSRLDTTRSKNRPTVEH